MSFVNRTTEGDPILNSIATLAANTNTTQALALPLIAGVNIIPAGHITAAAYILPGVDSDHMGAMVVVINNGSSTASIFPEVLGTQGSTAGGTINAGTAGASVTQIATSIGIYFAVAAAISGGAGGAWRMFNVAQL